MNNIPHIVDTGASVMNNEPVAYINVEERKLEWAKPTTWHTPTIAQMDKIPLYTHPAKTEDEGKVCARCGAIAYDPVITQTAKTLTDEEITKLHLECWDEIEFARAILRKAQEK
jgi:hypothetical protein